MNDLAIIVVSHKQACLLRPCLTTLYAHSGDCDLDVVVVSNSDDGTVELVEKEFPAARVVRCENRGFAHGNNRALMTCDARYVLFLNPDTEIREGTFEELVRALDERPAVGLAGVRQVTPDGALLPTIRRFPNALRALGEALGSESFPFRPSWLGERELDLSRHEREAPCDWTIGSFLFIRREAIEAAGFMDERFFLYREEPDLCLRIRRAGWEIRHLPVMTILHHADGRPRNPRLEAQAAVSRVLFARKHFSPVHRAAYLCALGLGYLLRALAPDGGVEGRRAAARSSLRALVGIDPPPFGAVPREAVAPEGRAE